MEKKHTLTTRKIVFAALMAALTVAGSALRVTLPLDIAGTTSFHLGNIMCALSGILLGPWLGGLASGLGSAIYDIMNPLYISECWITFLTKFFIGLRPCRGSHHPGGRKEIRLCQGASRHAGWSLDLRGAVPCQELFLQRSAHQRSDPRRGAAYRRRQTPRHCVQCRGCPRLRPHPRGRHPEGAGGKPSDDGITSKYAGCRTLCIPFFMAAPWDILPSPNPDRDIPCPSRFLSAECCSCDRTAAGQCRRH